MKEGPPIKINKSELEAPGGEDIIRILGEDLEPEIRLIEEFEERFADRFVPRNERTEFNDLLNAIHNHPKVRELQNNDGYWRRVDPIQQRGSTCVLACTRIAMAAEGLSDPGEVGLQRLIEEDNRTGKRTIEILPSGRGRNEHHFLTNRGLRTERLDLSGRPDLLIDQLASSRLLLSYVPMDVLYRWMPPPTREQLLRGEATDWHAILIHGFYKDSGGNLKFLISDPLHASESPKGIEDEIIARMLQGSMPATVVFSEQLPHRGLPMPRREEKNIESLIRLNSDVIKITKKDLLIEEIKKRIRLR